MLNDELLKAVGVGANQLPGLLAFLEEQERGHGTNA